MRWQLLVIGLLCISGAFAEEMQAYVDQPTTITTACIRNAQMRSNATATITIWFANDTLIVAQTNETSSGNGTFSFTYTFTQIGTYNTRETCDFGGILADGSTVIHVEKPTLGNMQVISQGVPQVDLGSVAKADWQLLLLNTTNATSNSSIQVTGGACQVVDIANVPLTVPINVTTTADRMTATFMANTTNGFVEGSNYEVDCNITLSDNMYVNGVKSYVYVNSRQSFLQYLLQLIGLGQQTQSTVNQTLNITNQTLAIVQNLNLTGGGQTGAQIYEQFPDVWLAQTNLYPGYTTPLVAVATLGSTDVSNATCYVTIYDQAAAVLVNTQAMTSTGGKYLYNWSVPNGSDGHYPVKINCTSGAFGTAKITKLQDVYVNGQVFMQTWG